MISKKWIALILLTIEAMVPMFANAQMGSSSDGVAAIDHQPQKKQHQKTKYKKVCRATNGDVVKCNKKDKAFMQSRGSETSDNVKDSQE